MLNAREKKSAAAKTRSPDWSVDDNTPYGISPFSSPFNQSELIKYKTRSDVLRSEIGYLRVTFCLGFKTSLRAKRFIWKCVKRTAIMNSFVRRPVLIQKQKATRKWHINRWLINNYWYIIVRVLCELKTLWTCARFYTSMSARCLSLR